MSKPFSLRVGPIAIAAGLLWLSGCITAGNYHSAKTLEKGESAFGVTASVFSFQADDSSRFTLPNLIPEVTYHVGVAENFQVGGRVALGSLALGLDAKWRFLQTDSLHLAIAPGFDYQAAFVVQGLQFKLPVVATLDLADNFGVNVAPILTYTNYSGTDSDFSTLSGGLLGVGGAVSVNVRASTFVLRPGIEYTRYTSNFGDSDNFNGVDVVSFFIHASFIRGKEKAQLNRIEEKLDRSLGNQPNSYPNNGYPPPQNYPPQGAPPPNQPPTYPPQNPQL